MKFNDRKIRLIAIPVMALVFTVLFNWAIIWSAFWHFAVSFLLSLLVTTTMWEGNRWILVRMIRQFPGSELTVKRLILQSILSAIYTCLASVALDFLINQLLFPESSDPIPLHVFMLSNLATTFFVVSLYEGTYFFLQWRANIKRSEALEQEKLRSELDALKSQVDPHFLFNSLNTLSALIDEENEPAQRYLEQLSDVYRYVLMSRQRELVSLKEEMDFVDAYIYLNKTRYRNNLLIEKRIPEDHLQQKVAPLSLQMLVENAIKHNIISREKPLILRISVEPDGYIRVENNLQIKNTLEQSTRLGLQNIINRYALLTPHQVVVQKNTDVFFVKIPLVSL